MCELLGLTMRNSLHVCLNVSVDMKMIIKATTVAVRRDPGEYQVGIEKQ